jgi:hypothetical protein
MPLRRTLTAMALGFLALTLVMGCAMDTTARGQQAHEVLIWTEWYMMQPGQQNQFMSWWLTVYFLDYLNYYNSLDFSYHISSPPPPWSPSPGPSIPVSFNTSGPQNTMQMLTTVTIPPTLPPQQQTLPPPPPPVSTPPGPQPPP